MKRLWILFLIGWTSSPLCAVDTPSYAVPNSSPTLTPSTFTWRTVPNTAFGDHEDLTFIVKWGLVTAGYSTLSIKDVEPVAGRPAYHIVSEARSGGMISAFYKVQDHNESWLDQESMASIRYEKRIIESKYHIEETTLIDQVHGAFHMRSFRVDKNLYEQKDGYIPPNVLDVLGSLYFVRLLPLEVGKSYTMDVLSDDKVYPLEVKVKKREKIKVPAGTFDTFRVEPLLRGPGIFISKGKKLEVWLTADARHMPVRMRSEIFIGHVSAELLPQSSNTPKMVAQILAK